MANVKANFTSSAKLNIRATGGAGAASASAAASTAASAAASTAAPAAASAAGPAAASAATSAGVVTTANNDYSERVSLDRASISSASGAEAVGSVDSSEYENLPHPSKLPLADLRELPENKGNPRGNKLEDQPWYHFEISKEEADKLLVSPGDFLVRYSKNQSKYMVCVLFQGFERKMHFPVVVSFDLI